MEFLPDAVSRTIYATNRPVQASGRPTSEIMEGVMVPWNLERMLDVGFAFHGHRCPAMPLGIRAGLLAMRVLGVERSADKELHVFSETGKGHAAGCFLDGIMVATGCTYGKSNVEKLYHDKLAFTLGDVGAGRSVRVSVAPGFLERMLGSPFVELRKEGVPPQDISPAVAEPLIEKVLALPEEEIFVVGAVKPAQVSRTRGEFRAEPCVVCGEMVFVGKLVDTPKGRLCVRCAEVAGA